MRIGGPNGGPGTTARLHAGLLFLETAFGNAFRRFLTNTGRWTSKAPAPASWVQGPEPATDPPVQSKHELHQAKEAAEAANQAKSAFLAAMSHDLRAPLNTILGYSQLLLQDDADESTRKRRVRAIQASGEHLLGIIDELLDLTRVEAGKLRIELRPVDLGGLLESLADEYRLRADKKGLKFEFAVEGSLPAFIHADPVRLRQVLHNLLSNAFKFTAAGAVSLRARAIHGRLCLEVADTGKGISRSDLPHLFEPFYQATGHEGLGGGVGLGLHITRCLTELMGGTVEVRSEPGCGSRFTVELPLRGADGPDGNAGGTIVGYPGPRRTVLIVDDEPADREVLHGLLARVGFRVLEAGSAAEADAILQQCNPDVVLADVRMAGVDGNTWCRQTRAGHPAGHPPLVACSANVLGDDRRQAHAAGFDAFVPKPVRESELFAALGFCLGVTWTHAAPEAGRAATLNQLQEALDRPVTLPLPPVIWLERVLGHVRVGDVAATRETIGALTGQHFEPFLARVRLLASSYRLSDLEKLVARALAQAQASATNRWPV